mmetsp:Transcript_33698/g.104863  ORF Transcript_33698/g.104863 Transcript_33698/m.104863 type:complete len:209 (-) Transcript_33698:932-1558(-)
MFGSVAGVGAHYLHGVKLGIPEWRRPLRAARDLVSLLAIHNRVPPEGMLPPLQLELDVMAHVCAHDSSNVDVHGLHANGLCATSRCLLHLRVLVAVERPLEARGSLVDRRHILVHLVSSICQVDAVREQALRGPRAALADEALGVPGVRPAHHPVLIFLQPALLSRGLVQAVRREHLGVVVQGVQGEHLARVVLVHLGDELRVGLDLR